MKKGKKGEKWPHEQRGNVGYMEHLGMGMILTLRVVPRASTAVWNGLLGKALRLQDLAAGTCRRVLPQDYRAIKEGRW